MKALRQLFDSSSALFHKGGKLDKFYPLYEAIDTFLFTPGEKTQGRVHVRDGADLKRVMSTVAVALTPCLFMAMYNTGLQANSVLSNSGIIPTGWRASIMTTLLGNQAFVPQICANILHGALYFLPIFLVCNIVGVFWEFVFASVRNHEINEGFLVTGLLLPLTLPPTIPLWQVAIGTTFGVIIGKEVFGGTGKNFLNPALTARAFLFFAYPAQISGNAVWVAVDGHTSATTLANMAESGLTNLQISWQQAFLGTMPGSMGETSALAALLGAAYLILTGVGSWRILFSLFLSSLVTILLLNTIGSAQNPMFSIPPLWHFVVGGFAFGAVFMATDPVSASMTHKGQFYYGGLIGFLVIIIRVVNPAFPEGMMLAILFGNVFAPLIDFFVLQNTIRRRGLGHGQR